jgi:hypothetical protein
MDNSFLVEEAYNQEPGVVQHILTGLYSWGNFSGTGDRRLDLAFTQEWPVFSQTHQFSYTVPYAAVRENGDWNDGVGDVLLNYRWQAYLDDKSLTGFSPRFSLVLPTGDARSRFGSDTVGYQFNFPFSTTLGDRWFVHANAGLTFLPNADPAPRHDLLNFNLGASAIYCVNERFNLMLEWIGGWNESSNLSGNGTTRTFGSVISPGFRYAFNLVSGAQIVVGAAVPLSLNQNLPDIGALFYFSFESRLFGKEPQP